jgi:hypothetical protein
MADLTTTDGRPVPEDVEEHLIEVFSDMPCDLSYDEIIEEEEPELL